MSRPVFDASAILCILQNERGVEKLTEQIRDTAVASSVNMAEVQGKLVLKGSDPEIAWDDALLCVSEVEALTAEQAKLAGTLIQSTAQYGLSLGDRSCLALAFTLGGEVYTTDRAWKDLKLGVTIHVIR
ncbi:MAG: type II toxin-antitoxin system VapC family toxin [Terracidiphilus sp.]